MDLSTLLPQILVNGLASGSVYVLMALGFTVIFGIMKVINFAHGALYLLGAYGVFAFHVEWGLPYPLAVVASVLAVGLFGVVFERTLVSRVSHDGLATLILTLGAALIIQGLVEVRFGVNPLPIPAFVSGSFEVAGVFLPKNRMVVLGTVFVVLLVLYWWVTKSRWGRALRAVSQDAEMATAQGIRTSRVFPLAYGSAAVLTALAGALLAPVFFVSPTIAETALIMSFIVVIIGGMGSVMGAVVAGFLVGVTESAVATLIGGDVSLMLTYVLVIGVLLFKPEGLVGRNAVRV